MLLRSTRRLLQSRLLRLTALLFLIWTVIETNSIHGSLNRAVENARTPPPNNEKIFIASMPWNNEIVLRTHLINQFLDLVRVLGLSHVFLSIYENGSYDGTKGALRDLYTELEAHNIRSNVVLDDASHEDEIASPPTSPTPGWVAMPNGTYAPRRIPYLSRLRNRVLEPLETLAAQGEYFDKILFLNDIIYTPTDILTLLATRDGAYATACSLDFESPPQFYDTFALRDAAGDPAIMQTWPFFRAAQSRNAMLGNRPVPVESCWNGAVVMAAAPFYNSSANRNPLRFRGTPDTLGQQHTEGSECCLIHADNPLSLPSTTSAQTGVYLNPAVRVGYCSAEMQRHRIPRSWEEYKGLCQNPYDQVHPHGGTGRWVGRFRVAWGMWENRVRRMWNMGTWNWLAKRRLAIWQEENGAKEKEPGGFCLVDEMQVLAGDGWRHV